MCNAEFSVWSTTKWSQLRGLNLDEFEIFWDIYAALCPLHFGMKPLLYGSETSHNNINILQICNVEFQFDRSENIEMTGSELRRIWDILGYLCSTFSAALLYEALVVETKTSPSERIYIAHMQSQGVSLIKTIGRIYSGLSIEHRER